MKKEKSYKESFDAGRRSILLERSESYRAASEAFVNSEDYRRLIKVLQDAGIKHPYNHNIITRAFDAGFNANNQIKDKW